MSPVSHNVERFSIKGWVRDSFSDWDGKISTVLFLPGCNFRCPFCQNWDLATAPSSLSDCSWRDIHAYLSEHKGFHDGVVITGGEPLISDTVIDLFQELKKLDLAIKLDTNGSFPARLEKALRQDMVDFVSMDIKHQLTPEMYSKAAGIPVNEKILDSIWESIQLLRNSGVPYEFRTTVVPEIHTPEDIHKIAQSLKGSTRYVLQYFRTLGVQQSWQNRPVWKKGMLEEICETISSSFSSCKVRGHGADD